jgi:hypothetical protein
LAQTASPANFGFISQNNSPGDHTTVNNDDAHQARDDFKKSLLKIPSIEGQTMANRKRTPQKTKERVTGTHTKNQG